MKRTAIKTGAKSIERGSTFKAKLPRPAMQRKRRKQKARIRPEIRERVMARSDGVCANPGCSRRASHCHHWLDEARFPELAKVEANLSGTCPWCNWGHHSSPNGRLPFEAIPACTLALAATDDRYRLYLERTYP